MKTEYTVTPAGIPLTFESDPTAETVAVAISFRAGSAYQGEIPGSAHFLEHCLLNGSVNYPTKQQLQQFINGLGAHSNGLTSREWAKYFFHCLPDKCTQASEWLREVICRPIFDEQRMIAERGIIANELNRKENESSFSHWKLAQRCFFGNGSYAYNVLGTMESINTMPPEYLRALYRNLYVKQNAQVAIVGSVTAEQAIALSDDIFGELADGEEQPLVEDPIVYEPQRLLEAHPGLSQDYFSIGFPAFGWGDERWHAVSLISAWLNGNGMPLYQLLRDQRNWVYTLSGGTFTQRKWGVLTVDGQIATANREEALEIIREFFVRLCNELISEKDLDILRNQRRMEYALDEQDLMDKLHSLGHHSLFAREAVNRRYELEQRLAVTREEIRDVAQAVFAGPEKVTVLSSC